MDATVSCLLPGILFIWAGFVSSISFMEAWLKFRAQGVTLPIGLGIGRKVFGTMNRTEWVFLVLYLLFTVYRIAQSDEMILVFSLLVALVLAAQTFLLLPRLQKRSDQIIEGKNPGRSMIHLYYVLFEMMKVVMLLLLGYYLIHSLIH